MTTARTLKSSYSSSTPVSVRNWWNRIILLLLITIVLNLTRGQHHGNKTSTKSRPMLREAGHHQILDEKKENIVHKVAGLSCEKYGGPLDEIAAEMVYWQDIPSDASFVSPFKTADVKYLTFEPDMGGWNNVRMAMETVVAMAHTMGRTLVLPPEQRLYLLEKDDRGQKATFTFADFFHFDSVANEHMGITVITFEEFLQREAMAGKLRSKQTGQVSFPPYNRTNWNGRLNSEVNGVLFTWMRTVSATPMWNSDDCIVTFPARAGHDGNEFFQSMNTTLDNILTAPISLGERIMSYRGNATPVDAPPEHRLRELMASRKALCLYDTSLQQEKVIHMMGDINSEARLLVHFYTFLFWEDWKQDLWTKRFVRDHLRYVDEIQCAAARVVHALRQKSIQHGHTNGVYDALHIRRGDFQYTETRLEPDQLYDSSRDVLTPNSTLYIATDERNRTFFEIFQTNHHQVYFLDDFDDLLTGLNTNYYGMVDQRIASRAETFVGTYFSTFTGYINRMRGYHSQLDQSDGYEMGKIQSFYFVPQAHKYVMQEYGPIFPPLWGMEFPIGWRDLDRGLDLTS